MSEAPSPPDTPQPPHASPVAPAGLRWARRMLAWSPLLCLVGWFWLAMYPLFIGPADWDDTMYADRAISGAFVWDVRNRYVHVWAIRVLDLLLPVTHRTAAGAWGALAVCALAGLAYWVARRVAGPLCGLVALLLTLCFPPMLKYLSVPHVDFSMALFGLVALLSAVLATETTHVRVARVAAAVSGLCAYLALKSKETALVVPPLCLYVLFGQAARPRYLGYLAWAFGLALGFCMLFTLDRSFAAPTQRTTARASDLGIYFTPHPPEAAAQPPAAARQNIKHEDELLELLTQPSFAAFTLLGLAGFARAAQRNIWLRTLGLWALSVLVFTVWTSAFSHGVDAQDRYVIALAPALGPLAAYWLFSLFREPLRRNISCFFLALLIATTLLALSGLLAVHVGDDPSPVQSRAAALATPLALLLLFLAPWGVTRTLALGAAVCALAISIGIGSVEARRYRDQKRHELEPWLALSERLDAIGDPAALPHIAVLNGRSYRAARLRWRLHVLSKRPWLELGIRDVERVEQLEPHEWVFVGAAGDRALQARDYERVLSLESDPRPWSLYEPPHAP